MYRSFMKIAAFFRAFIAAKLVLLSSVGAFAEGARVQFSAKDGTPLSGLLHAASEPKALLLVIHGMQSHAEWFLSGEYLAEKGITTLAIDRRGSGLSGGAKGHANSAEELLDDVWAGYKTLAKQAPAGLPIHLHVNCYGTRIAFPYIAANPEHFRSMIVTSPSTPMRSEANYNVLEKAQILVRFGLGDKNATIATPLKDELFLTNAEGLRWIQEDTLSLRRVTFGFLKVTNSLTQAMKRVIPALKTPMLFVLGDRDEVVNNEKIERDFYQIYSGPKKLLELSSEKWRERWDSNPRPSP
jgi:alpha-beta hydrolase superfamily lysophospholipase